MNTELIIKYLTSECVENELVEVNQWLDESAENQKWLFDLKALWDKRMLSELADQAYLDKQLALTFEKITASERPAGRISFYAGIRKTASWVAAACAIAFAAYFAFTKNIFPIDSTSQYIVENVPPDESIRKIILPDSTVVWLGGNSELKYAKNFEKNERRVLLRGEAYFDVKRMTDKPFRVETPEYIVKVLGTKFNVASADTRETTETTLFSGKVVIENSRREELVMLSPGQKLSCSKQTKHMSVENIEVDKNSAGLMNNFISFRNAPLQDIAKKLEYTYGVPIQLEADLANASSTYTGAIQCEDSLENLLKGLQNTIAFEFFENKEGGIVLKNKRKN